MARGGVETNMRGSTETEPDDMLEQRLVAPEQLEPATPTALDLMLETTARMDVELDGGPLHAALVLVAGASPGQVYSLGATTVIGRDPDVDVRLADAAVSRRHARVTARDERYVLEDLGSVNGTFVGGVRIARRELVDGDRIQLGPRAVLRFSLLDTHEERMHRHLFESSTRDPLTNAYNKGHVTERLTAEVAHARRHHSPLELVIFDLDRFKYINDCYGHLAGDTVLRAVAERIHALIRSEDVFGRFGGEEFVVLTRGADAQRLAERLRLSIEHMTVPLDSLELRVTVSLGVARLDELPADASAAAFVDAADRRLLHAKRSGRNRICARA